MSPVWLCIVLIVVGLIAGGIGVVAMTDPEGRGGNYLWLFLGGVIAVIVGLVCLASEVFG